MGGRLRAMSFVRPLAVRAVTLIGVLLTPALYVIVERYISRSKPAPAGAPLATEELR